MVSGFHQVIQLNRSFTAKVLYVVQAVQDFRQDAMKVASGYDVEISYPANRESLLRTLLSIQEEQIAQKIGTDERARALWALLM